MREERRVVTALFADVVGSTALAERHDPEEARLIVGEAIARAVRIVEAYGGTVKDLAGDGMLALFGAPIAHEDDPERALRAGLEIAAAITDYADEVRRGWGVEGFGIRLGVETGEVVVGEVGAGSRVEYGATGDAVNVAARLQTAAAPGRVMVGPRTRRLAGDRFAWGDTAQLELKGKSEPVAAAPVLLAREGGADHGEPAAPLTGRDAEMRTLTDIIDALHAGRGGVVFVSGEPGIGKSRLTAEARRLATDSDGATWLEGRAVSYGASLSWWPVRDLLRSWIGVGTQEPELRSRLALRRRLEETASQRAASMAPYLANLLGLSADAETTAILSGLSPEAVQFQSYEVLVELVSNLAGAGPLVLAIDDLHWADATTIGLLERLLPLAETLPVLLFFNHRPETAHPSWALREKATREFRHLVTTIDLEPLDPEAERSLLRALSEGALPADAEARLVAYAEGNPLYLEELARALGEGGTGSALPSTLEGVIMARLDRLEPDWRDLVTAASACGRTFSIGLLEAVYGRSEQELRPALHNLQRLDLLNEERRWPEASYRFKHALIQEAAYRTLVSRRRQDLHARAARWLEARYSDSPERVYGLLAHHWLQAADTAQAETYLRLAGEQALGEWSLDEAVDHFRALVRVLRDSGRESEAARPLYQLASTLHLAMRYSEANEAWMEATALWRPPERSTAEPASFVMGVTRVPWNADPLEGFYASIKRLVDQLHDSLFTVRPGPSIEPRLAERLEVDSSGLVYRIHLREGLTYNSGRALDAASLVAGLRSLLQKSGTAAVMWRIKGAQHLSETGEDAELGIRAVDERTVELTLDQRDPAFHIHFTTPEIGPVLEGERSGPYRLVEMTDERVVIEADPDYPRALPGNVRRAEWVEVPPERAAEAAAAREIDALVSYPLLPAEADLGLTDVSGPPVFLVSLDPTGLGPPVDRMLRRALALGLDRTRLLPHLLKHQVAATGGLVPPGIPGHTPDIALNFDADGARKSLAQSSHRGPLLVACFVESRYPTVQAALDCWRDVLGLEVEAVPIPIRENRAASRRVHVMQNNWIAHVPDPGYFLKDLHHSASRSNLAGTADPELDAMLDRAEAETTGSERMGLYHAIDRYVVAEACHSIPLFYARMVTLVQPWVRGWWEWGNPNQLCGELEISPDSPRYSG